MKSHEPAGRAGSPKAGAMLREWRDLRGKSQLELSFDAGVSQKHISFVESGRSQPSPRMLLDLAEALDVPLRERNAILLAAGYAPRCSEEALDAPSMAPIATALRRMLSQNEPFPAVVMDRRWDMLLANNAAPRFFGRFVDLSTRPAPRNLLHLLFDPAGLRPFVVDWPATARMLLARVQREGVGGIGDPGVRALLEDLGRYPDVDTTRRASELDAASPMIPLSFAKDGVVMNYFSLVTTVGAPHAVATQELRLECMMPSDDETERRHREFVDGAPAAVSRGRSRPQVASPAASPAPSGGALAFRSASTASNSSALTRTTHSFRAILRKQCRPWDTRAWPSASPGSRRLERARASLRRPDAFPRHRK